MFQKKINSSYLQGSKQRYPSSSPRVSQILFRTTIVALSLAAICAVSIPIIYHHFSSRVDRYDSLYIQVFLCREGVKAEEEFRILKGAELRDFVQLLPNEQIQCLDNATQELKQGCVIFLTKKGKMNVVEKKLVC